MSSANTTVLLYGTIVIAVLLFISLATKEKTERGRLFLFWSMTSVMIFVTAFITLDTVFKNIQSVTKGPVHWHTDFQIWGCGERVDLLDPTGLSNRIGTPVFHEHNDERIHVEGTIQQLADVNLQQFFNVLGGELTTSSVTMPTNDGVVTFENGDLCLDGSEGTLQVFKYETNGSLVTQTKLEDFTQYIPAPEAVIPPGDCIIIEFGEEKELTENICTFYKVAIDQGDLEYGN